MNTFLASAQAYADDILQAHRVAGRTMLNVTDVMQILRRKDRPSTIAVMREQMGAIKDGLEWKVPYHKVRDYLILRFNPSLHDQAARLLKPAVSRTSRKVKPRVTNHG